MNAFIIGNFDVQARSPLATFQNSGIWYDYFSGDSILIESLQTTIELEPGEFHIFTTKKLPSPEKDILLDISYNYEIIPEAFTLEQNYPNPFNPATTIKYTIPVGVNSELPAPTQAGAIVNMVVYDILGRKLKTLVNEIQTPGNYEVIFDAGKYASGIYYYQLKYGDYVEIKKMILLK